MGELLSSGMRSVYDFDLVSVGECLAELSREEGNLFRATWAGDAVNTLYYASRLGLRCGFVTTFGDDLFTETIRGGIAREKIDLTCSEVLPHSTNGIYAIELDSDGEYTFHFWRRHSAARETLVRLGSEQLFGYLSRSRWLLFSGITLAVMNEREILTDMLGRLRAKGTGIAFDTNYRPSLWSGPDAYRSAVAKIARDVDLFLPSRADLSAAWPDSSPEDVLEDLGVERFAMKNGADPCLLRWDGSVVEIPVEPVRPLDTTGAGDAFNAGFLTGLIRGNAPLDAAGLGVWTAARALSVRGAIDPNFPRTSGPS